MKKKSIVLVALLLLVLTGCNSLRADQKSNSTEQKHLVAMQYVSPDGNTLKTYAVSQNEQSQTEYFFTQNYGYEMEETKVFDNQGFLLKDTQKMFESYISETTYLYDENRQLIRAECHSSDNSCIYVDYYYDSNGLLTQENHMNMDVNEKSCNYEYNEQSQMIRSTTYLAVSNYNYVVTEYSYDADGLLVSEYAQCYEDLNSDPIGYMSTEYTYDSEGRLAAEEHTENIYGGYGNGWKKNYDYSYKDILIVSTTGTEAYITIHLLNEISEEIVVSYEIWGNMTIAVEDGLLAQIKTEDGVYNFQYE